MQISSAQLNEFAVGCESTEIVDGAWRAHRLPAGLRPAYDEPPRFAVRRDCPSSVRLRFVTDSKRIDLSLRFGEEASPCYRGTIVVDSAEPIAFGPHAASPQWHGRVLNCTEKAPRLIDIWLPPLCKNDLVALCLDDGCDVHPAPAPSVQWLVYGDSITQGMSAALPTLSAVGRCALAVDAAVHNLAVGGSSLLPALADHLPAKSFDLVSIAYGINDFNWDIPIESFQRNASRLIQALRERAPDSPILVLTPISWPACPKANALGLALQDYRDALYSMAERFPGVHLVLGEGLVDEDVRWFLDPPHPNDRGFELYARNLLPHLSAALGPRGRTVPTITV